MSIRNLSETIIEVLKEMIHLTKILIAIAKAEKNPGHSKLVRRMRQVATEEGVDHYLMLKIVKCESNFNVLAMNRNRSGSIDRGLFQWNDFYHPEISNDCAFNIECSTKAYCKAIKQGNLYWWDSSKHCWG